MRNKLIISLATLALLSACQPAAETAQTAVPSTAAAACDSQTTGSWTPPGGPAYAIEARASGPSCENAVALLVVRGPDGEPLLAWSGFAKNIMPLAYAKTSADMTKGLEEWLQNASAIPTTADLPEWPEGADGPAGEFPFLPSDWIGREDYLQIQASSIPVFCHIQGMESMACYTLEDPGLSEIGVQIFPG